MSNALEQASLIMVPSGYEDGTLGSLKPTDGSGDFTFTRCNGAAQCDLAATRVNADGYIEKGYENTLLGSNDFALDDSYYTITSGEAGYDSTNDAWLVNKLSTGNRYFRKDGLVYTGVMTISIYAKAGTLDRLVFITAGDYVLFDLENVNAYRLGGTPIAQTIELVSGTTDWYRCSLTINKSETNNLLIKPVLNNSAQDAAGTIYIQDAMLNQGMVAYPYVETTTAPVAGGILEDMPRLDYSNGSCPSLLLEPSRTNLFQGSEFLTGWNTFIGVTPQYNYGISPEGLNNSVKLPASGNPGNRVEETLTLSTGVNYTFSVYIKNIDSPRTAVMGTTNDVLHIINWSGDEILNVTDGLKYKPFGNGWYRIWETSSSNGSSVYRIYPDYINYAQSIEIYGLQLEQATYPTSYIPTYGVSQTRLVDSATASVTNTTSRTYFLDGKRLADEGVGNTSPVYYPNDNLKITFWTNNRFRFRFGGAINSYYTLVGDDFKIAISYNGTDSKIFVNGVYWMTQSSFNLGNISALSISGNEGISYNQLLLFPTALSDDECIALTTIS